MSACLCLQAQARTVRAINAVDDSPIVGAVVTVDGNKQLLTDSDGRFNLPENTPWAIRAAGFDRQSFTADAFGVSEKSVSLRPFYAKGIYLSQEAFWDPQRLDRILTDLRTTSMNTLVIDVKSQEGSFLVWQHADELKALVDQLHREGFYVIAKLAVFKDHVWARAHPESALKSSRGKPVRDNDGLQWLNPADRTVWLRVIKQANQTAALGFDEIQFDFVRFPTVADTPRLNADYRSKQIREFLTAARWALVPWNVFISADLYGYTAWDRSDTRVGQRLHELAPSLDYISLMLYPSLFHEGAGEVKQPLKEMAKLIQTSLENAQERTGLPKRYFRPWLQAFRDVHFDRREFQHQDLADQIKGAENFGVSGYLLWRTHSDYIRAALPAVGHRSAEEWGLLIEPLVQEQINENHIQGAVVLVGQNNETVFEKAYGLRKVGAAPELMTADTIFDLASITKALATTIAVLQLSEQGKLSLDETVIQYWPEFAQHDKDSITLRDLLTHYAGLRPDLDLSTPWIGYDTAMQMIVNEQLVRSPKLRYVYSDIGFEVLGELVQKVTGQSLPDYCEEFIFKPLGMTSTRFLPPETWKPRIAPTQDLPGRVYWGTVHDATTRWMGGVAGHAGVFSTAQDLAVFAQMLINGGVFKGHRILSEELIKRMTMRQSPIAQGRSRGLGWDLGGYQGYTLFPASSYGHLGYTGSMLWIQPDQKRFLIVMTNRTYPDATGDARPLREALLGLMER